MTGNLLGMVGSITALKHLHLYLRELNVNHFDKLHREGEIELEELTINGGVELPAISSMLTAICQYTSLKALGLTIRSAFLQVKRCCRSICDYSIR